MATCTADNAGQSASRELAMADLATRQVLHNCRRSVLKLKREWLLYGNSLQVGRVGIRGFASSCRAVAKIVGCSELMHELSPRLGNTVF